MSNLTSTTNAFSVTEKVQYALKTALFRTMQTAFGDSGASEKAAPPRIFPKDIMQTNLVEIGKGDIDEDGYFASRAMGSGYAHNGNNNKVNLEAAELIIAKYRIIDPSTNVITTLRVETLAGDYSNKNQSTINGYDAAGSSSTNYPKQNWFFRGHYGSRSGTTAFNAANANYDGLQLAWDKATPNTVAAEADIVPHLKYYLQVQTTYTTVSDGSSPDNITYIHDKMKGLIGLDQNFTTTIAVNTGEGHNCGSLNTSGTAAGEYWFTQATSGTLAFYGVGTSGQGSGFVSTNKGLNNLSTTEFPMISYVRYVGETGFGVGSGGGGTTLTSNDANVSNMIGGTAQTMTTTSFEFDGEVYINNYLGVRPGYKLSFGNPGSSLAAIEGNTSSNGNLYFQTNGSYRMYINPSGYVGIGTTSPGAKLDITKNGPTSTTDSNATEMLWFKSPFTGGIKEEGGFKFITDDTFAGTTIYPRLTLYAYQGTGSVWQPQAITFKTTSSTNVNVGIGTTSPLSGLQVIHDDGLTISGTATTGPRTAVLRLGSPYTTDVNSIENYCAKITSYNNHTQNYGSDLRFFTHPNGQSYNGSPNQPTERMCIKGDGEVGIGWPGAFSSSAKLNVNGEVRGHYNQNTKSYFGRCYVGYSGDSNYAGFGHLNSALGTTSYAIRQYYHGQTDVNSHTGYPLTFRIGNAEHMRVDTNGNVGIGKTPSAKLDVNGTIYAGYNQDVLSYLGRTWIGHVGGLSDHAGIGHIDHMGSGEYAIMVANTGKTYLGSVSGQSIGFRIGNSDKMELNTSGQLKVGYNTDVKSYFGRAWVGMDTYSDTAGFGHIDYAGSNYALMQNSSGNTFLNTTSSGTIYFRAGNSTKMEMNNNGVLKILDYIEHYSDSNTKIGFPSNDNIYFYCAGAVQMRLNNNGVGIHTDAPANSSTRFQVGGNVNVAGDVNFTGTLYKNGVLANADWCCEVEWNTGNAGGTRQVKVNGVQLSTGTNSICAIYLNKDGTYKGISNGYYLYPGNSTNKGYWNSLADEINNQDNGTVVILVSADWICPIATGGSAETLFKSIGSYEATRNVLPNSRNGYICCFIKGNYGCIEKCGDDSTVHNGKVFFTYYNLLNITNGLYNYSTTESPDIQGTNPFFGDVRACHGQMHMGYNLGGTALVGLQSLGTTSSSSYTRGFDFMNAGDESMMTILHYGTAYTSPRVGIGTRTPSYPLHVTKHVDTGSGWAAVGYMHYSTVSYTSSASNDDIAIKADQDIWAGGYLFASSDRRIKYNIEDVPDNLALDMVRNIPCRYYEYKDKIIKGSGKTIGFIAQEVKEIMPMAVSTKKTIIPDKMCKLDNISWNEIKDASGNITLGFQLISDLQDVSGIKYRFFVSNDPSGNEKMKEIVGNSDNTFTFEEKWNDVFCYGKEVDDFHILTKEKLFTLNFSATQELDKKVIALETKNTELENKVATLESELAAIKQHLGI